MKKNSRAPEHDFGDDPCLAQKGMHLPGNLTVLKRLGQGAYSVALLVQRDAQVSPGQRVVIPESWLRNVHRGAV